MKVGDKVKVIGPQGTAPIEKADWLGGIGIIAEAYNHYGTLTWKVNLPWEYYLGDQKWARKGEAQVWFFPSSLDCKNVFIKQYIELCGIK